MLQASIAGIKNFTVMLKFSDLKPSGGELIKIPDPAKNTGPDYKTFYVDIQVSGFAGGEFVAIPATFFWDVNQDTMWQGLYAYAYEVDGTTTQRFFMPIEWIINTTGVSVSLSQGTPMPRMQTPPAGVQYPENVLTWMFDPSAPRLDLTGSEIFIPRGNQVAFNIAAYSTRAAGITSGSNVAIILMINYKTLS